MRRAVYIAAFTVLALAAALLTLRVQHTVSVLVATRDLRAGTQLQSQDVEVRRVHEDGVPSGSLSDTAEAVGRYVWWPLTAGEPVLARALRDTGSGGAMVGGLDVPQGYRAVAVPVQPAGAVGGMLSTGDHVDVFATPLPGHDPGGAVPPTTGGTTPASGTVLLGHDVLVLQLRTDQGAPLDPAGTDTVHGLDFGAGKLGSVVLAVPAEDVDRYAQAASADTVYLALTVG